MHLAVSEVELAGDGHATPQGLSVLHGYVHEGASRRAEPGDLSGGLAFWEIRR
ncbi:MAG: hypothetical protein VW546_03810 [Gammaproteobacteria bacterium]